MRLYKRPPVRLIHVPWVHSNRCFCCEVLGCDVWIQNDVSVMFLVGGLRTCDEDLLCCCDVEVFCCLFLVFGGLVAGS